MELKEFIEKIAEQLDEEDAMSLSSQTEFKYLEGWTSLTALSVIAMVDDEYGVSIKGSDIRQAETLEDLFHVVKNQKTE